MKEVEPSVLAEYWACDENVLVAAAAHVYDKRLVAGDFFRKLYRSRSGVGAFEREQNAFVFCKELNRVQSLAVQRACKFNAAFFAKGGKLRADSAIVKACADRAGRQSLSVVVKQKAAFVALHDSDAARVSCHARGVLSNVGANASRFHRDKARLFLVDERSEKSDGVGAASAAGYHRADFDSPLGALLFNFAADHALEFANDVRERRGPKSASQNVMGAVRIRRPVAHRFVDRVL